MPNRYYTGLIADDDSKLFQYRGTTTKFLKDNGYDDVQSHDFRVFRACELFITGFSIERLQRYFNHSTPEIKSLACILRMGPIKREKID